MPIRHVSGGYKWGSKGKTYPTREGAARQARAAYANGYTGKEIGSMDEDQVGSDEIIDSSAASGWTGGPGGKPIRRPAGPSRPSAVRQPAKINQHKDANGSTEHHRNGGGAEHANMRRFISNLRGYQPQQLAEMANNPNLSPAERNAVVVAIKQHPDYQGSARQRIHSNTPGVPGSEHSQQWHGGSDRNPYEQEPRFPVDQTEDKNIVKQGSSADGVSRMPRSGRSELGVGQQRAVTDPMEEFEANKRGALGQQKAITPSPPVDAETIANEKDALGHGSDPKDKRGQSGQSGSKPHSFTFDMTYDLDDPTDRREFAAFKSKMADQGVDVEVVNPSGPGGGWPEVRLRADDNGLAAIQQWNDEEGNGDDLETYRDETIDQDKDELGHGSDKRGVGDDYDVDDEGEGELSDEEEQGEWMIGHVEQRLKSGRPFQIRAGDVDVKPVHNGTEFYELTMGDDGQVTLNGGAEVKGQDVYLGIGKYGSVREALADLGIKGRGGEGEKLDNLGNPFRKPANPLQRPGVAQYNRPKAPAAGPKTPTPAAPAKPQGGGGSYSFGHQAFPNKPSNATSHAGWQAR